MERRELNDFQELLQNLPLLVTVSVFIFCKTILKSPCNTILKTVIYQTLWRPKFQILWYWQIYNGNILASLIFVFWEVILKNWQHLCCCHNVAKNKLICTAATYKCVEARHQTDWLLKAGPTEARLAFIQLRFRL